jgi:predicted Zn-dependent protease
MLAEALAAQKRPADAAEAYQSAVRLEPGQLDWQFALARALADAGQPQAAADVLRSLLKRAPEYPQAADFLKRLMP